MVFRFWHRTGPQALGRRGEREAARFLKRRGYHILNRNYTCRAGELDIVAADGETLVFVEVKTRSGDAAGYPENAVDRRKRVQITRAARHLLARIDADPACRFDVVSVVLDGQGKHIEHFIDAFEPTPQ